VAKDLSIDDLRYLILKRRSDERRRRYDHFQRTGKVVMEEPVPGSSPIEEPLDVQIEYEDEIRVREGGSRRSTWMDKLLLVVEAGAVIGLLFILMRGISLWQDLNREVSASLVQPILTPTPLIMAVVLPSGHTSPNSPGGARPNEAEIPEHLRPLVQSLPDLPVPTPGPRQAIRIQIPAIGVDSSVIQGDGWEQLKKGVGQYIGTPNPGEKGNIIVSAHNDVFGEIFRDLDQLKDGDLVVLFTSQRTYTYAVQQVQILEPTQVEVMAPSQEPIVTLISCYPYMVNTQRIAVTAVLQEE